MTAPRLALPLALACALALGLAYAATVRLPVLFLHSDAVLTGAGTALLALALCMMLPDRLLHSEARLIRHAFSRRHDVTEARAGAALEAVQDVHAHIARLERARPALSPELAARVDRARDGLGEIEAALFREPSRLPVLRPVIVRAAAAIEAVEGQAELRGTRADDTRKAAGRDRASAALDALERALDALEDRRTAALGDEIDVAAGTAEILMGRGLRRRAEDEGDAR